MEWNKCVRQTHRWLSIVFTAVVIAIFVALGIGTELVEWVYFLPLFPLALMLLSGLYLFFLPYVAKYGGHHGEVSGSK